MIASLVELQVVRVVRREPNSDSWNVNRRPPLIGDVGTVVEVLRASSRDDRYVVEGVALGRHDDLARSLRRR